MRRGIKGLFGMWYVPYDTLRKKAVSSGTWEYMMRRMSLGLVRARAKTWEAGW